MRKMLAIASREYNSAVKTKSFLFGLLLMPVLIAGSAGMQIIVREQVDTQEKRIAVVDRTPKQRVFPILALAASKHNADVHDPETHKQAEAVFTLERLPPSSNIPEAIKQQRLELSEQVVRGDYFGFVEIGPQVLSVPSAVERLAIAKAKSKAAEQLAEQGYYVRFQTNRPTYRAFPTWLQTAANVAILETRLQDAKLSRSQLELLLPVMVDSVGLSKKDLASGKIEDPSVTQQIARYLVPAGLVGLMFMVIMFGSPIATQGVVEEKMQRIAEVLLGSVTPFQLMTGKLIGLMGVSLTIALVYLAGAYWAAWHYGFAEYLSAEILAWYFLFQILAVLMYGSAFLALGAAATDIKEMQTLLLPLVLVACIPMLALTIIPEDPNGPVVVGTSFFPPVTPMMMTARLAVLPEIPLWQPLLGVLLVVIVTVFSVFVAGRIFRVGILMQGKGAKFSEMLRWAWRG